MRRMRVRSRGAALAAVGLAVGLAGCSVHPGAAAVVDGRTISEDYVADAADDLGLGVQQALSLIIAAPYYLAAAEASGVAATAEEAHAAAEAGEFAGVDSEAELSDGAVEIIQLAVTAQSLSELDEGSELMREANAVVVGLDMDINPRYGSMNPENGLVSLVDLPWIVTGPVEEPVAG
jgi:hypothetical protein